MQKIRACEAGGRAHQVLSPDSRAVRQLRWLVDSRHFARNSLVLD